MAYLSGPKKVDCTAEQEERKQQHGHALQIQGDAGHGHRADLAQLDDADQPRFLELVGQRTGRGGKQHEWQDQQAGGKFTKMPIFAAAPSSAP